MALTFKALVYKNSRAFNIPKPIREELGIGDGDSVHLVIRSPSGDELFSGRKKLKSGPEIYGKDVSSALTPGSTIVVEASEPIRSTTTANNEIFHDPRHAPHPQYSSINLQVGTVYTREQLRRLFRITDATLNTGMFQPPGISSVWIFLTEHKTSDRTQYDDLLDGDTLYFQGQTQGRKDNLIINHNAEGLELLIFYRKAKTEYPGAGFRYEGPFRYLSYKGTLPRSFVLRRIQDEVTQQQASSELAGAFDPNDIQDGRQREQRAIALRRGQQAFRSSLLNAYGSRCAITQCDCPDALEAAHIYPYQGDQTNTLGNGILLRADIHILFDLGLISIDPGSLTVVIAESLKTTSYSNLQGAAVSLPTEQVDHPTKLAFEWHLRKSGL